MNIKFKHLQDIDLNQNNDESPFIQLEVPDNIQEEDAKKEEKEPKRVIIIDL